MPGTYAVMGFSKGGPVTKRGFVTIGPEFPTGHDDESFVSLNFHLSIDAAEKLLADLPAAIAVAKGCPF